MAKQEKTKLEKIPNIAIIGCSSAGKSTIVRLLAEMSGGVVVSLDSKNADGRSLVSVVKPNPKEFMEGDPIREKMMQEAKEANRHKKPFFIDDAFTDIIPYLNRRTTKIVLIVPTIDRIIKNVKSRNLKAVTAGQERFASNVLSQLANFIDSAGDDKGLAISICAKDIYTATELDKMFYDQRDWCRWEAVLLQNLHYFGFGIDDLKSKPKMNKHKLFFPKNIGQHITIIADQQTPQEIIKAILTG